jgi:spore coat protein U-like protein
MIYLCSGARLSQPRRDGGSALSGRPSAPLLRTRHKAFVLAGAGLLATLALAVKPDPAAAQTATATIGVTSAVVATCLISATPMAFGNYIGALVAATATVTVTCTNTTPYNVGLDAGLVAGGTVTTRGLTGPGAAVVNYVLTSDAAYAVNWGVTAGTDTVAGIGTGAAQPLTVYGQEAAGQYVTPGAYTDTITATVTY